MKTDSLSFYAKVDNSSFQYESKNLKKKKKTPELLSQYNNLPQKSRNIHVEYEKGTKKTEELNNTFFQEAQGVKESNLKNSDKLVTNKSLLLQSEKELSVEERVKKHVLEKILSKFDVNLQKVKLIPNDAFSFSYEQVTQTNLEGYPTSIPNSFEYAKIDEHHELINANFTGKIVFETKDEVIEMDLNLSYSREFYIRNEKNIGIMEKNLAENKLFISEEEFGKEIKNLDSVDIAFDALSEFENTKNRIFFEYLNKILQTEQLYINPMGDFKMFMKNQAHEYEAVGVQKEGSTVFLSSMQRVAISA